MWPIRLRSLRSKWTIRKARYDSCDEVAQDLAKCDNRTVKVTSRYNVLKAARRHPDSVAPSDAVADRDYRYGLWQSCRREEVLPQRRSGRQDADLQCGREQLQIAVLRQLGDAADIFPSGVDSRRI